MDFSLLFMFLVAAVVSATLSTRSATGRAPKRNPRAIAFAATFIVGMLLMRPWSFLRPDEWKEFIVITFVLVAWLAFGSVAGGAIGRKIAAANKKGPEAEAPDPS